MDVVAHKPSADTPSRLAETPLQWLAYATWFALAASLGEIALLTRAWWLRYRFPEPQFTWWLPLGYLLICLPLAVLTGTLLRGRTPRTTYAGVVGVLAFVAGFGVATGLRKFEHAATIVLALGFAIQVARAAMFHSRMADRWLRLTLPLLVLGTAAIAAVSWGAPHLSERRALAALPAARPGAPNVLLIVLDTVRAKSLGLYGYNKAATPNLDRLARRGVIFDRAMATAPWTLPSHASMFTGRWPHELRTGFNEPLDDRYPTLAELFGQHGYVTAGFSANSVYGDREFGLSRGFAHFEGRPTTLALAFLKTSPGRVLEQTFELSAFLSPTRKLDSVPASGISARLQAWLDSKKAGAPFFAFLNVFDAHDPYLVDDDIGPQFPADQRMARVRQDLASHTPQEIAKLNLAYDAAIASLDRDLGAMFDALERRGDLANTVVVITADHGEQFGEHQLLRHSSSLYTPLVHVPLLVSYPPALPQNVRVRDVVSLRDLAATVVDLSTLGAAGVRVPGHTLRPCWTVASADGACGRSPVVSEVQRGNSDLPDWYPSRRGRMRSIVVDGMHYIRNEGDGREELYDLTTDMEESHDLAGLQADRLGTYRDALEQVQHAE